MAGGAGAEFQTQSEARIQLSRTNEYFPGTSERIMMISGTVNQVLTALHLVLAKMNSEKTVLETMLARCVATCHFRWVQGGGSFEGLLSNRYPSEHKLRVAVRRELLPMRARSLAARD